MRLFRAALILIAVYTIDHMYLDGQNAAAAVSIARSVGASINQQVADLLRPLQTWRSAGLSSGVGTKPLA
jgi:hypothetical protein